MNAAVSFGLLPAKRTGLWLIIEAELCSAECSQIRSSVFRSMWLSSSFNKLTTREIFYHLVKHPRPPRERGASLRFACSEVTQQVALDRKGVPLTRGQNSGSSLDAADSYLLGCSDVVIFCSDEGAGVPGKIIWKPYVFTLVSQVNKQSRRRWGGRGLACLSKEDKKKKKSRRT